MLAVLYFRKKNLLLQLCGRCLSEVFVTVRLSSRHGAASTTLPKTQPNSQFSY